MKDLSKSIRVGFDSKPTNSKNWNQFVYRNEKLIQSESKIGLVEKKDLSKWIRVKFDSNRLKMESGVKNRRDSSIEN